MQVVFVNLLMRSKGLKVATTLILAAIAVIVAYLVNQLPPLQALPGGLWVLIGVIVLMTLLTVALQLLGGESTKNQTSGAPNSLRSRLLKAELEEVDLRRRDSLHQQITQELNLIDVDFANHPEQVGRPSELLVNPEFVANDGTVTALPSNQKMSEVFHRVGGRLLILGEPGPGKTTQLLELAKSLDAIVRVSKIAFGRSKNRSGCSGCNYFGAFGLERRFVDRGLASGCAETEIQS
jgi:hypothetical protein